MDSQVPPAPPTPTVTKPFPRNARSRARATAEDAAWLRKYGSGWEAMIESSDLTDPKAYRLLREIFGPSTKAAHMSTLVAVWFHDRFTGRLWKPPSLPDNKPEIPELHELLSDARKMLPKVERVLEYTRAGELAVGDRRVSKQLVRWCSNLAEQLKCIPDGPRERSRRSDEWHVRARLYAQMIEGACHTAGVPPPTRNSTNSPLVLAVQGLLRLEGCARTPDAVRKVLGKIRG
jgi:hypothetical protein